MNGIHEVAGSTPAWSTKSHSGPCIKLLPIDRGAVS
jgi:hypothetical protein